jgi:hypothetical protein
MIMRIKLCAKEPIKGLGSKIEKIRGLNRRNRDLIERIPIGGRA